ncbi:MAG: hypothetical protein ACHQ4G_03470 [Opitutales bacterium]
MLINGETFADAVAGLLARYGRQNGLPAPAEGWGRAVGLRLWALLEERGWPRPLAPAEMGEPGEMTAEEVAPLIDRLPAGAELAAWSAPLRQLVKACFQPEFKTCRDSYRECGPDGSCRRQDLGRVRVRLSGTHCVDCPYWTALDPAQHVKLLARHWHPGGWPEFEAQRAIFLPEDFRRLRQMIRAAARGIRT